MAGKFDPDWATHPGEHIDEYIEVTGVTFQELEKYDLTQEELEGVIEKRMSVDGDLAARLEEAFGLRAHIWLSLQEAWDARGSTLFDQAIKDDAESGRLDDLEAEARADHASGKTREL